MGALSPIPLERLAARAFAELERNGSIYDLPARKFVTGGTHDVSVPIHGRTVSAPLGPSAGPHTQMAQNIVLAWLAGARVFELKTVQQCDALTIPRPCIDVRTVALNVEWSQELRLEESLEEYVKASMLIEMLAGSGLLGLAPGFDRHLFDMSVGYDLEGIRSERMVGFMRGLIDAKPTIDALRSQLPKGWREHAFRTEVAPSVTVSTFHGCPVSEIEQIAGFLMGEMGLDCTIKLNPTLLGSAEVREILHDRLGYTEFAIPASAFEKDPEWDEAETIVGRLMARAKELGRSFAVKLTNTLIVENTSDFLPQSERFAYLSGPPLHVIAMHLAARFRRTFGAALPLSFSAGIDRINYPDAVRMGLAPVTVCTDLLKQGGYGRLQTYAAELSSRMDAAGAKSLADFVTGDFDACLAQLDADPRYRRLRPHQKKRSAHQVFQDDCSMCDLCIPACPNGAIFPLPALKSNKYHDHQIGCLVDLCNDCGNCETFCPDGGAPNRDKYLFTMDLVDAVMPPAPDSPYALRAVMDPSRVNFLNCLSLPEKP